MKAHTILMLDSLSTKLGHHIECFIFFLTSAAVSYLITVNYSCNYLYFKNSSTFSKLPYLVLLALLVI